MWGVFGFLEKCFLINHSPEVNALPTFPEIMPRTAPTTSEITITINALLKLAEVSASIENAGGVCNARLATLAYPKTLAGNAENTSICANRHIIKTVAPTTIPAQMGKVSTPAKGTPRIISNAIQARTAPRMEQTIVFCNAFPSPPIAKKHAHAMNTAQIKTTPVNGPRHNAAAIPPSAPMLTDKAT